MTQVFGAIALLPGLWWSIYWGAFSLKSLKKEDLPLKLIFKPVNYAQNQSTNEPLSSYYRRKESGL